LISDAKLLDETVDPQLRENLFSKLSHQKIETTDKKSVTNFSYFNLSKLAIAASLLVTLLIIQPFDTEEATNNIQDIALEKSLQQKIEAKPVVAIGNRNLIASNHLGKEYSAILADMEKIKHRIVSL
jgi:hypothetical protein